MSEPREAWAETAYREYREHRGALGPIIDKEVEAGFFDGLRRGLETNAIEFRWGQPPWKVEDAFEVWRNNKYPGSAKMDGRLIKEFELDLRTAFIAGAEYGAAAGSEGGFSENRTGEAVGAASPVAGNTDYPPPTTEKYVMPSPPLGETPECNKINPASSPLSADEKCFFLRGHPLSHSWELRESCLAFRADTDLAVRAFCCYKKGHPNEHSWEELRDKLTAEIWDNTVAGNPDMEHSTKGFRPLVPTPRRFWQMVRARDLAQAIKEHLEYDEGAILDIDGWINELRELWETM